MSILIPLVKKGITFNEVPDKMAVYLELGDCKQNCKGCHSPELQSPDVHYQDSDFIRNWVVDQIDSGANAIVVLGGTTSRNLPTEDLIVFLQDLARIAPVCLYSGRDDEISDKTIAYAGGCSWLKTGSYQEKLGGLDSPITNQKFYYISDVGVLDAADNLVRWDAEYIDQTYKFREGYKHGNRRKD